MAIRSVFHLTQQFCDKSLTLSWMLMEMNMMMWTEFVWLRMGSVAGSCEWDRWQALVNALVKLRILQNAGRDLLA